MNLIKCYNCDGQGWLCSNYGYNGLPELEQCTICNGERFIYVSIENKKKIMFIFNDESELEYKYEMFKELLGEKILYVRDREWNCTWATGRNIILFTDTHEIFLTLDENCHRVGRVPYLFNLIQDKKLHESNLKFLEKRDEAH